MAVYSVTRCHLNADRQTLSIAWTRSHFLSCLKCGRLYIECNLDSIVTEKHRFFDFNYIFHVCSERSRPCKRTINCVCVNKNWKLKMHRGSCSCSSSSAGATCMNKQKKTLSNGATKIGCQAKWRQCTRDVPTWIEVSMHCELVNDTRDLQSGHSYLSEQYKSKFFIKKKYCFIVRSEWIAKRTIFLCHLRAQFVCVVSHMWQITANWNSNRFVSD